MSAAIGFRLRLRVRMGKPFTTKDTSLSVKVAGRDVTIKSHKNDEPLSEAQWIVLSARGFVTEIEARNFGEQLRSSTGVAALCSRLGTDTGRDQPTSWVNEEFARSSGFIRPHERLIANIHGLTILPDDDNTRIPIMDIQGKVTADPDQFVAALAELGDQFPLQLSEAGTSLQLLNFALINSQPLAQIALAFSAVEALGQDETWTETQSALIMNLASKIEEEPSPERAEVADALRRGLHRIGLRQGVMRVLSRLDLNSLRKEWDRLYGLRSGLFHGTVALTEQEISQLAVDVITMCGQIVLTLVEHDGTKLPSVAAIHFRKP